MTLRRFATMLAAAALVAPPALAQQPPPAQQQRAAQAEAIRLIDLWLNGARDYDRLPALSAAIVQGDDVIWAAGYGTTDAARQRPAAPDTLYSICSISKLFTAVALMQQWEAGKVTLDAPLTQYLPWAKLKPVEQDSVPVTLRGLLTHSSGMPRESDFPYWTGAGNPFPTDTQVRDTIGRQEPLFPASRWFQYSNLGLTLAGDTVAAVSGEDYAGYARRHLLTPLGLKDTYAGFPLELYGTRMAVGWGAMKRDASRDPLPPFDTRGILPAAGYVSTVEDLGKFAAWQFRLLRTGKAELLKASTLREMQRVHFTDPSFTTTWGLGFAVNRRGNRTYVGHGGSCPGYHSSLLLRPDSETAVVAMATGAESPGTYVNGAFALLDRRAGFAFKAPAPADVSLDDYVGRYTAQPWADETVMVPWAGGLATVRLQASNPAEELTVLKPKGRDRFRVLRDDGSEADEVVFERDRAGRVVRFIRFSNPYPRAGDLPRFTLRGAGARNG